MIAVCHTCWVIARYDTRPHANLQCDPYHASIRQPLCLLTRCASFLWIKLFTYPLLFHTYQMMSRLDHFFLVLNFISHWVYLEPSMILSVGGNQELQLNQLKRSSFIAWWWYHHNALPWVLHCKFVNMSPQQDLYCLECFLMRKVFHQTTLLRSSNMKNISDCFHTPPMTCRELEISQNYCRCTIELLLKISSNVNYYCGVHILTVYIQIIVFYFYMFFTKKIHMNGGK